MFPIKMWRHFLLIEAITFRCMNISNMVWLYFWNRAISKVTNALQVFGGKLILEIYSELLETRGDR